MSFNQLIKEYDWDFTQLQFNYVDRDCQGGETGLTCAREKGIGTIIMEPLRGGQLANDLNPVISKELSAENPQKTLAAWGFEYLWNHPCVDIVLSGMNTMKQLTENIELAANARPGMLSESEEAALERAGKLYQDMMRVPCTVCRYCGSICPQNIWIPGCMEAYNRVNITNILDAKYTYRGATRDSEVCVGCGACKEICPQHIDIPEIIKELQILFP